MWLKPVLTMRALRAGYMVLLSDGDVAFSGKASGGTPAARAWRRWGERAYTCSLGCLCTCKAGQWKHVEQARLVPRPVPPASHAPPSAPDTCAADVGPADAAGAAVARRPRGSGGAVPGARAGQPLWHIWCAALLQGAPSCPPRPPPPTHPPTPHTHQSCSPPAVVHSLSTRTCRLYLPPGPAACTCRLHLYTAPRAHMRLQHPCHSDLGTRPPALPRPLAACVPHNSRRRASPQAEPPCPALPLPPDPTACSQLWLVPGAPDACFHQGHGNMAVQGARGPHTQPHHHGPALPAPPGALLPLVPPRGAVPAAEGAGEGQGRGAGASVDCQR